MTGLQVSSPKKKLQKAKDDIHRDSHIHFMLFPGFHSFGFDSMPNLYAGPDMP